MAWLGTAGNEKGMIDVMTPKQLKQHRTRLGWTQEDAARRLKVSVRTWARWESGTSRITEAVSAFVKSRASKIKARV